MTKYSENRQNINYYYRHSKATAMIHYFDNCATTRVDDDIVQILNEYHQTAYFNPSARSTYSLKIANDIAAARASILNSLHGDGELVFTSGGTESDNLAIRGALRQKKGNVVVTASEHSAVFNTVSELGGKGYEVRVANTRVDGSIDADDFLSKVDGDTLLACFMHVNNETGVVNDIATLNSLVKAKNAATVTFSDGVQAVGKIPVNLRRLGVDMYAFSGHKIHCTKGIGALYIGKNVRVSHIVSGGGQEKDLRSGTEYVGGIVALAQAVSNACANLQRNTEQFLSYKQAIRNALSNLDCWQENCTHNVSPAIMSLAFADVKGEVILHMLERDEIIVGTGSACSSKNKQSRIAKAIGLDSRYVEGILRLSFSKYNTLPEAELLGNKLHDAVVQLRKIMRGN